MEWNLLFKKIKVKSAPLNTSSLDRLKFAKINKVFEGDFLPSIFVPYTNLFLGTVLGG